MSCRVKRQTLSNLVDDQPCRVSPCRAQTLSDLVADKKSCLVRRLQYGLASRLSKVWRGYPHNLSYGQMRKIDENADNCVKIMKNTSIIEQVDHFIGCDSVGQHFAYSLGTPSTVITGATFPE